MKTIKLAPGERLVTNQLNRKGVLPQNIVDAARDIVANVRANGDAAVRDYCQRFNRLRGRFQRCRCLINFAGFRSY